MRLFVRSDQTTDSNVLTGLIPFPLSSPKVWNKSTLPPHACGKGTLEVSQGLLGSPDPYIEPLPCSIVNWVVLHPFHSDPLLSFSISPQMISFGQMEMMCCLQMLRPLFPPYCRPTRSWGWAQVLLFWKHTFLPPFLYLVIMRMHSSPHTFRMLSLLLYPPE